MDCLGDGKRKIGGINKMGSFINRVKKKEQKQNTIFIHKEKENKKNKNKNEIIVIPKKKESKMGKKEQKIARRTVSNNQKIEEIRIRQQMILDEFNQLKTYLRKGNRPSQKEAIKIFEKHLTEIVDGRS